MSGPTSGDTDPPAVATGDARHAGPSPDTPSVTRILLAWIWILAMVVFGVGVEAEAWPLDPATLEVVAVVAAIIGAILHVAVYRAPKGAGQVDGPDPGNQLPRLLHALALLAVSVAILAATGLMQLG